MIDLYPPELLTIFILLLVPIIAAFFLAIFNKDSIRTGVVCIASGIIILSSLFLAYLAWGNPLSIVMDSTHEMRTLLFFVEVILAGIIIALSLKYKKYLAFALGCIQLYLLLVLEMMYAEHVTVTTSFLVNELSIIMVLIIGIIGTLICVYALGYMKDYHHHHLEVKDRRPYFFALLFLFLTAMFGVVLSNNLLWVLGFWEVTTLCSFLLIGYTKTSEATDNAFRAVWMNILGGIAFTLAIIALLEIDPNGANLLSIENLINYPNMAALTIPSALIAFAGITKAAQMPFSTWLTGAMVAPTPVSALLHSSTMVKAGVYLLVVFAPIFSETYVGVALTFLGLFTFLVTAVLAISQSNAKKVLAYSTISNLGLITACAGVGTPEAVTAAILLIIFHAVAKALLFLCVGAVENKIGSKDIEDMDGLLVRLPLLASMMVIGICGMYLAPFGMLISKWTAIIAFLDSPFGWAFVTILAFGSAFTLFFWTKWLGKLFMRMNQPQAKHTHIHATEKIAIISIGALTLLCCVGFIAILTALINPYIARVYTTYSPLEGLVENNMLILLIMFVILAVLVAAAHYGSKAGHKIPPYLCGREVDSDGRFLGSLGVYKEAKSANYYMQDYFGEGVLLKSSWVISLIIIIMMFVMGVFGVMI